MRTSAPETAAGRRAIDLAAALGRGITTDEVVSTFDPPYMAMGADGLASALAESAARIGAIESVEADATGDDAVRAAFVGDRAALLVHVVVNPETGRVRSAIGTACERLGAAPPPPREPEPEDRFGWGRRHQELGLVGSSLAVIRNSAIDYVEHRGVASTRSMNPVTETTPFGWGSVTKPITTLAVLRLVDDGRVDLDAPANAYLRHFRIVTPSDARDVTVRDLLTHRTGVLDGGSVYHFSDYRPSPRLAEFYAPELLARGRPGETVIYDNHGFGVLGQIIEDVAGKPFNDAAGDLVFRPSGAQSGAIGRFPFGGAADLHMLAADKAWPLRPYEVIPQGAGALVATIDDMASVLVTVVGATVTGSGMWTAGTINEMFREHAPGRGLGIFISTRTGDVMAWHTGGGPGMTSIIAALPDHGHAVAIVTNTNDDGDRPVHRAMERLAASILVQLRNE